MMHFMMHMRKIAVRRFAQPYYNPPKNRSLISLELIQKALVLEDHVDAINCMRALGFSLNDEDEFELSKRDPADKWMSNSNKFRQANLSKLDDFVQDKLRRQIVEGGLEYVLSTGQEH